MRSGRWEKSGNDAVALRVGGRLVFPDVGESRAKEAPSPLGARIASGP